MDFFCIDRTTLLDNPGVKTLEEPGRHSVHCLVDIPSCFNSPFEVLLDPKPDQMLFTRGFQLDNAGKATIITLARNTGRRGSCSTCAGMGDLGTGFRAVMDAEIVDLNEGSGIPPTISVIDAQASHDLSNACIETYNMTDISMVFADSNQTIGIITDPSSGRTPLQRQQVVHGCLMLIGWGFLLPSGALFARFFKHRPDGLWFKIHRFCEIAGLLFAIIGWIVALRNFQVFADKGYSNYRHGILGMVTMCLGLLQPINAVFRPAAPKEGQERSKSRLIWEIVHKSLGYMALILAIATISLGTTILPSVDDQKKFQIAYGVGAGGVFLFLIVALNYDKSSFPKSRRSKDDVDIEKEEHSPLSTDK